LPGSAVDDGSIHVDNYALDEDDPNYDSEDDNGATPVPKYSPLHRDNVAKSNTSLVAYKKRVESIASEYFVSGDMDDTACYIQDIDAPEFTYEFVKRLINMSCDQGDRERELVSQLLSTLYPDIFSSNAIGKGFERLFEIIDEIEKDAPAAKQIIATFLARAVVDEILPPSFLADAVVSTLGGEVVEQAKLMLSRDHGSAKLERSWGPGDGRPVEDIKVSIDQILQEYLLSSDVNEALRCFAELKVPLYFHEVVKRAVINAMDRTAEEQVTMSALLAALSRAELLSSQQAVKGFNRLYHMLPDLALDTPAAVQVLANFEARAKADGVLAATYSKQQE